MYIPTHHHFHHCIFSITHHSIQLSSKMIYGMMFLILVRQLALFTNKSIYLKAFSLFFSLLIDNIESPHSPSENRLYINTAHPILALFSTSQVCQLFQRNCSPRLRQCLHMPDQWHMNIYNHVFLSCTHPLPSQTYATKMACNFASSLNILHRVADISSMHKL